LIIAVATVVLAVFAIVTAWYARQAYLKQSKEVSDQAKMLGVQSKQLAEQRKINEEQTKVLDLQATELSESLAERKREAAQRKIAQASRVFIWIETTDEPLIDGIQRQITPCTAIIAHLKNTSQQPVYDIHIVWRLRDKAWDQPDYIGSVLMPGDQANRMRIINPNYPGHGNPALFGAVADFRDATGWHWQANPDGPSTDIEEEWELG
jgi:hypothetical protein